MSETSVNNKRIAKNTLLLYFRSFLLLLLGLYTSRLVLHVLGVENYGIYNLVGGVITMFAIIGNAMASASQRFITYALGKNDYEHLRKVFETCQTLQILQGVMFSIILEVLGVWFLNNKLNVADERMMAANYVFQFSVVTTFISVISVPYDALIIAHERMKAFAYISIFEGLMKLGIVWILMFLTWDKLIVYGALLMLVAIIKRLFYIRYCRRRFAESRNLKFRIDGGLFKEMFSFSAWNLLGNSAAVFRNQGVDILINIFYGVGMNAAKGICNQVQGAVYQFVVNFQTAVNPQLTKSIAQHDYQRAYSLVIQGARYSVFLLLLFIVPLCVDIHEILGFWLVEVPYYTVEFIYWTFLVLLNDALNRFLLNSILASGNIRAYQIVVSGTKMLVLPISYIIFKFGGNAATGLIITFLLDLICMGQRLYFNKKQINFPIRLFVTKAIICCWAVAALAFLPPYILHRYIPNVFVILPVSAAWTLFVIAFVGLSKRERSKYWQIAQAKIKSVR